MMDAVKKLFRKHLMSGMSIFLVFLIVNTLILIGIAAVMKNMSDESLLPIAQVAEHIRVNDQWVVSSDDEVPALLSGMNAWAMVLDDSGVVVWEESLPEQFPRAYRASDIANFSRWYLNDHPVLVHTLPKGLLVVGYAPESLTKIYLVLDADMPRLLLYGGIIIIVANLLIVFFLFLHNTRRVEKAIVPILHGIDLISKGESVTLPEKGQLAEISKELNLTSEHIRKKDKARADWINGISHDVRTPLSVMLGYAGEMEDDLTLPEDERKKAAIIREQGEKLGKLITDLNLTSRLEYSMQPLNIENLYPVELTRQVVSGFLNNGLDEKYCIEFEPDSDMDAVVINGDSSLISRMLDNLIQNSIFHNPDGCKIVVSVGKLNENCTFTITDNGKGLTEEQLTLFRDSAFAESSPDENIDSCHGFGLRLAQQIASAHGGSIKLENLPTGGLTVTALLAISQACLN